LDNIEISPPSRDPALQPAHQCRLNTCSYPVSAYSGIRHSRQTYSTLLKANGEDAKVVQELMRHANISTTMNIYTKALTSAKREAQSRVVDVLLDRSRDVVESAEGDAA
jgi:hypothetical protein